MKQRIAFLVLIIIFNLASCNDNKKAETGNTMATITDSLTFKSGYSEVNGIKMYYEIHGQGKPLVLIHGGGSTIETSFGRIIPQLSKHRQAICVELQAHGRTGDRNTDLSFEQDADDIATLLKNLNINKADFFGFSNGGTTALQIAIRHPDLVDKIIAGSALCKRNGVPAQFWDFMKQATLAHMPKQYKDAYTKVAASPGNLQIMHDKCAKRMVEFKDINDEHLKSIKVPTLIVIGDKDVMTPEHAIEMHRLIPNAQLAIIPGEHGAYIGEVTTLNPDYKDNEFIIPLIEKFLDEKPKQ